jgi:hypothetical protein
LRARPACVARREPGCRATGQLLNGRARTIRVNAQWREAYRALMYWERRPGIHRTSIGSSTMSWTMPITYASITDRE